MSPLRHRKDLPRAHSSRCCIPGDSSLYRSIATCADSISRCRKVFEEALEELYLTNERVGLERSCCILDAGC